jgi:hypothetical protein
MVKAVYANLFDWLIARVNSSLAEGAKEDFADTTAVITRNRSLSQLRRDQSLTAADAGTVAAAAAAAAAAPEAAAISAAKSSIAILDIFGFETFEVNSFEQLLINYCNQKLQCFFDAHIFELEQEEYRKQGVEVPPFDQERDNRTCLSLLERKPAVGAEAGLLLVLDEEGKIPRGSDKGFLSKATKAYGNHTDFLEGTLHAPPSAKLKMPKTSRKDSSFSVHHYAGFVSYEVKGLLEKNSDKVHEDTRQLLRGSSRGFIKMLMSDEASTQTFTRRSSVVKQGGGSAGSASAAESPSKGSAVRRRKAPGGKGSAGADYTLAKKFRGQLDGLVTSLKQCEPHFVRCLKPTTCGKPKVFEVPVIRDQVRCCGLPQVCAARRAGYPIRIEQDAFIIRYRMLVSGAAGMQAGAEAEVGVAQGGTGEVKKEALAVCAMLERKEVLRPLSEHQYAVGHTKVFFTVKQMAALVAFEGSFELHAATLQGWWRLKQAKNMLTYQQEILWGVEQALEERSAENVQYWLEQAKLYLPYMPEVKTEEEEAAEEEEAKRDKCVSSSKKPKGKHFDHNTVKEKKKLKGTGKHKNAFLPQVQRAIKLLPRLQQEEVVISRLYELMVSPGEGADAGNSTMVDEEALQAVVDEAMGKQGADGNGGGEVMDPPMDPEEHEWLAYAIEQLRTLKQLGEVGKRLIDLASLVEQLEVHERKGKVANGAGDATEGGSSIDRIRSSGGTGRVSVRHRPSTLHHAPLAPHTSSNSHHQGPPGGRGRPSVAGLSPTSSFRIDPGMEGDATGPKLEPVEMVVQYNELLELVDLLARTKLEDEEAASDDDGDSSRMSTVSVSNSARGPPKQGTALGKMPSLKGRGLSLSASSVGIDTRGASKSAWQQMGAEKGDKRLQQAWSLEARMRRLLLGLAQEKIAEARAGRGGEAEDESAAVSMGLSSVGEHSEEEAHDTGKVAPSATLMGSDLLRDCFAPALKQMVDYLSRSVDAATGASAATQPPGSKNAAHTVVELQAALRQVQLISAVMGSLVRRLNGEASVRDKLDRGRDTRSAEVLQAAMEEWAALMKEEEAEAAKRMTSGMVVTADDRSKGVVEVNNRAANAEVEFQLQSAKTLLRRLQLEGVVVEKVKQLMHEMLQSGDDHDGSEDEDEDKDEDDEDEDEYDEYHEDHEDEKDEDEGSSLSKLEQLEKALTEAKAALAEGVGSDHAHHIGTDEQRRVLQQADELVGAYAEQAELLDRLRKAIEDQDVVELEAALEEGRGVGKGDGKEGKKRPLPADVVERGEKALVLLRRQVEVRRELAYVASAIRPGRMDTQMAGLRQALAKAAAVGVVKGEEVNMIMHYIVKERLAEAYADPYTEPNTSYDTSDVDITNGGSSGGSGETGGGDAIKLSRPNSPGVGSPPPVTLALIRGESAIESATPYEGFKGRADRSTSRSPDGIADPTDPKSRAARAPDISHMNNLCPLPQALLPLVRTIQEARTLNVKGPGFKKALDKLAELKEDQEFKRQRLRLQLIEGLETATAAKQLALLHLALARATGKIGPLRQSLKRGDTRPGGNRNAGRRKGKKGKKRQGGKRKGGDTGGRGEGMRTKVTILAEGVDEAHMLSEELPVSAAEEDSQQRLEKELTAAQTCLATVEAELAVRRTMRKVVERRRSRLHNTQGASGGKVSLPDEWWQRVDAKPPSARGSHMAAKALMAMETFGSGGNKGISETFKSAPKLKRAMSRESQFAELMLQESHKEPSSPTNTLTLQSLNGHGAGGGTSEGVDDPFGTGYDYDDEKGALAFNRDRGWSLVSTGVDDDSDDEAQQPTEQEKSDERAAKQKSDLLEWVRQDPMYARYLTMAKAGLPNGAVRQRMELDKMPTANIEAFFGEGDYGRKKKSAPVAKDVGQREGDATDAEGATGGGSEELLASARAAEDRRIQFSSFMVETNGKALTAIAPSEDEKHLWIRAIMAAAYSQPLPKPKEGAIAGATAAAASPTAAATACDADANGIGELNLPEGSQQQQLAKAKSWRSEISGAAKEAWTRRRGYLEKLTYARVNRLRNNATSQQQWRRMYFRLERGDHAIGGLGSGGKIDGRAVIRYYSGDDCSHTLGKLVLGPFVKITDFGSSGAEQEEWEKERVKREQKVTARCFRLAESATGTLAKSQTVLLTALARSEKKMREWQDAVDMALRLAELRATLTNAQSMEGTVAALKDVELCEQELLEQQRRRQRRQRGAGGEEETDGKVLEGPLQVLEEDNSRGSGEDNDFAGAGGGRKGDTTSSLVQQVWKERYMELDTGTNELRIFATGKDVDDDGVADAESAITAKVAAKKGRLRRWLRLDVGMAVTGGKALAQQMDAERDVGLSTNKHASNSSTSDGYDVNGKKATGKQVATESGLFPYGDSGLFPYSDGPKAGAGLAQGATQAMNTTKDRVVSTDGTSAAAITDKGKDANRKGAKGGDNGKAVSMFFPLDGYGFVLSNRSEPMANKPKPKADSGKKDKKGTNPVDGSGTNDSSDNSGINYVDIPLAASASTESECAVWQEAIRLSLKLGALTAALARAQKQGMMATVAALHDIEEFEKTRFQYKQSDEVGDEAGGDSMSVPATRVRGNSTIVGSGPSAAGAAVGGGFGWALLDGSTPDVHVSLGGTLQVLEYSQSKGKRLWKSRYAELTHTRALTPAELAELGTKGEAVGAGDGTGSAVLRVFRGAKKVHGRHRGLKRAVALVAVRSAPLEWSAVPSALAAGGQWSCQWSVGSATGQEAFVRLITRLLLGTNTDTAGQDATYDGSGEDISLLVEQYMAGREPYELLPLNSSAGDDGTRIIPAPTSSGTRVASTSRTLSSNRMKGKAPRGSNALMTKAHGVGMRINRFLSGDRSTASRDSVTKKGWAGGVELGGGSMISDKLWRKRVLIWRAMRR